MVLSFRMTGEARIPASPASDLVNAVTTSMIWQSAIQKMKQTSLWAESLGKLEQQIQNEGKDQFAVLKGILEDLVKVRNSKSGRWKILSLVSDKAFATLNAVNALGTAVTALNPYAALAWSTIQFLISTAMNARLVGNLFWENVGEMTDMVSKYQTCEEVYLSTTCLSSTRHNLEEVLESLYMALLKYQINMVMYAQSRTKRFKASLTPSADSVPQNLLDDIARCREELTKQLAISNGELAASTYRQVSEFTHNLRNYLNCAEKDAAVLSTQVHRLSDTVESQYRDTILNWLSPARYETSHMRSEKTPISGTTGWIMKHDLYRSWVNSDGSAGLWLRGFMGSGKSCLTHAVIEDRKRACGAGVGQSSVAYVYCDSLDRSTHESTANQVFACLLKQVADITVGNKLAQAVIELYQSHERKAEGPTRAQCVDLLIILAGQFDVVTFIVDGLDECSLPVREDIITTLRHISNSSNSPIKTFIASRDEMDIKLAIEEWFHEHINIAEYTREDINMLIERSLAAARQSPRLRQIYHKPGEEDQGPQVIYVLTARANGMFRWVQMAFDYLHGSHTYQQMKQRLKCVDRLDKLFDLHDAIYKEMMVEAGEGSAAAIEAAFNFLLHKQPLYEWSQDSKSIKWPFEVVTWADSGGESISCSVSDLEAHCPSFLLINQHRSSLPKSKYDNYVVQFAHFSVREYLVKRHPEKYSERAGNAHLASLCMKSLAEHSSLDPNSSSRLWYATVYWLDHILLEERACKRNEKRQNQISDQRRSQYECAIDEFLPMLGTSVAFEKWHSLFLHRSTGFSMGTAEYVHGSECSDLFVRILLDMKLNLTQRPAVKLSLEKKKRYGLMSFAAVLGRVDTVISLLETGTPDDVRGDFCCLALEAFEDPWFNFGYAYENDLFESVQMGDLLAVVKYLLNNCSEVSVKFLNLIANLSTKATRQSLHTQALRKVFLDSDDGFDASYRNRLLRAAVEQRSLEAIVVLVEGDADPCAGDSNDRSAVNIARETVKIIVKRISASRERHDEKAHCDELRKYREVLDILHYLEHKSVPSIEKYHEEGWITLSEAFALDNDFRIKCEAARIRKLMVRRMKERKRSAVHETVATTEIAMRNDSATGFNISNLE